MDLVWRARGEWRPILLATLCAIGGPTLIARARARHPGYLDSAPPDWLDRLLIEDGIEIHGSIADHVAECLTEHFSRVRLFHAGRPDDPADYRNQGLRILDRTRAVADLRQVVTPEEVSDEALHVAIEAVGWDGREGTLYLALDDRELLDASNHYLWAGSEFIQGVLVQIAGRGMGDYTARLRRKGIPTVVEVGLPTRDLDTETKTYLANALLSGALYRDRHPLSPPIDFTVTRHTPVPPEQVIGHAHPDRPQRLGRHPKCDWCRQSGAT